MNVDDIRAAAERLKPYNGKVFLRTPTIYSKPTSDYLESRVGRSVAVYFKCEHIQPVGSFKIRGALNFALSLSDEVRQRGIITHSSGNHGIAVAAVGEMLNIPVVVITPKDTTSGKVKRIRTYGADIVFCEPGLESREITTKQVSNERHMTIVPPFDHVWTMAGQGTIGLEILEDVPDADVVVAAVGGCGMISGITVAIKALNPSIKVYGAEPVAVNDTWASLRVGRRVGPTNPRQTTICDALRISPPGVACWEIVSRHVDGVLLVSDDQTVEAMKFLAVNMKQVTEPSGACATGLLFTTEFSDMLRADHSISKIVVIICGGNIELEHFVETIVV